jgi:hypothetical protein
MAHSIEALERQRAEILEQMQALGDMRRGSVVEQYLKCGKTPCCCKVAGHPGHGPYFAYTRKVQGKTQTRQLRPGPALAKLTREVETFHRFRQLCNQLLGINERLCDLRPLGAGAPGPAIPAVKKTSARSSGRKSAKSSTAS